MELVYTELGIEVTRRCNQQCSNFCMRGPMQNIDISLDSIDLLLDRSRNQYSSIGTMIFSGGEPTLNPKAIAYTIDRIVSDALPVEEISMVTNGLEYCDLVVEAFEKYSQYYDSVILPKQVAKYPKKLQEQVSSILAGQGSYIYFSNDQFHKPISNEVLELYHRNGQHIVFAMGDEVSDDEILKSGFAKEGRLLDLNDNNIRIFSTSVLDLIYLTAKGNLSCYGDGSYDFLDEVSTGYSITDYSLEDFCFIKMSPSSKLYYPHKKSKVFKKIK